MRHLLHFEGQKIARWSVMVLCAGWTLGAIWFAFVQPQPAANPYFSYAKKVAKCRELPTSETRYNCTSKLMLAEDNAVFNDILLIVLPPLAILMLHAGVTRAITARRERLKGHRARIASHQRMEEWRKYLRDIKSGAATRRSEEVFSHMAGPPSGTPPPRAKKR